jgi:8-oxo-dGTP pyrophosphatase MutT (NUDIX family)
VSYGAIVFRIRDGGSWNQSTALVQTDHPVATGLESVLSKVEVLLIQRRDSIGYVEMMRGKYKTGDTAYIEQLLSSITAAEREKLLTRPFDTLWQELWGPPQESGHTYRSEKETARQKLEALRADATLRNLCERVTTTWSTPEWGFPKGRREHSETEYACAMRELWEETNLSEKDLVPIRNMEPLQELYTGSNSVRYLHKYFLCYCPPDVNPLAFEDALLINPHMRREVGNMKWVTGTEALELLRPDQEQKRQLLQRFFKILKTYCPLRMTQNTPARSELKKDVGDVFSRGS